MDCSRRRFAGRVWPGALVALALLLASVSPGEAAGSRRQPAQPPPPPPRLTVSISHLVNGVWRKTTVTRLGEEVRFEAQAQRGDPAGTISRVDLTLRATHLGQDGYYQYGGTLYLATLHESSGPNGVLSFTRQIRLGDRRMLGKIQAEFDATHNRGTTSTALMLTVKDEHGEIPGGDPHTAAYWGLAHRGVGYAGPTEQASRRPKD